jgi:hypothetical protein
MVKDFKSGQMVRGMLGSGSTTKLTAMGNFFMPTEMYTKECGLKIRRMVKVSTPMEMVLPTKAAGRTTSRTVGAKRFGQMAQNMKETLCKEGKKGREL